MITRDTFRNEWTGLSTDDWTMTNLVFTGKIENGDIGFEMDTTKVKRFNADTNSWIALN